MQRMIPFCVVLHDKLLAIVVGLSVVTLIIFKCLLILLPSGYEKFNLMRQDPCLCFLVRCGPPDGKAVLAEQNDDEEMK